LRQASSSNAGRGKAGSNGSNSNSNSGGNGAFISTGDADRDTLLQMFISECDRDIDLDAEDDNTRTRGRQRERETERPFGIIPASIPTSPATTTTTTGGNNNMSPNGSGAELDGTPTTPGRSPMRRGGGGATYISPTHPSFIALATTSSFTEGKRLSFDKMPAGAAAMNSTTNVGGARGAHGHGDNDMYDQQLPGDEELEHHTGSEGGNVYGNGISSSPSASVYGGNDSNGGNASPFGSTLGTHGTASVDGSSPPSPSIAGGDDHASSYDSQQQHINDELMDDNNNNDDEPSPHGRPIALPSSSLPSVSNHPNINTINNIGGNDNNGSSVNGIGSGSAASSVSVATPPRSRIPILVTSAASPTAATAASSALLSSSAYGMSGVSSSSSSITIGASASSGSYSATSMMSSSMNGGHHENSSRHRGSSGYGNESSSTSVVVNNEFKGPKAAWSISSTSSTTRSMLMGTSTSSDSLSGSGGSGSIAILARSSCPACISIAPHISNMNNSQSCPIHTGPWNPSTLVERPRRSPSPTRPLVRSSTSPTRGSRNRLPSPPPRSSSTKRLLDSAAMQHATAVTADDQRLSSYYEDEHDHDHDHPHPHPHPHDMAPVPQASNPEPSSSVVVNNGDISPSRTRSLSRPPPDSNDSNIPHGDVASIAATPAGPLTVSSPPGVPGSRIPTGPRSHSPRHGYSNNSGSGITLRQIISPSHAQNGGDITALIASLPPPPASPPVAGSSLSSSSTSSSSQIVSVPSRFEGAAMYSSPSVQPSLASSFSVSGSVVLSPRSVHRANGAPIANVNVTSNLSIQQNNNNNNNNNNDGGNGITATVVSTSAPAEVQNPQMVVADGEHEEVAREGEAASKLQAIWRGRKDRREYKKVLVMSSHSHICSVVLKVMNDMIFYNR
jgi:hypothetical protein